MRRRQKIMAEQATASERQNNYTMPNHGEACWIELASKDVETAKKFYTELLGWQMQQSQTTGFPYSEIQNGGRSIGGMYQMTKEYGDAPTHWMSYIAVDDVDALAKRVEELGGKVCVPPTDIPNTGRFCIITDPTGGTISLITLSRKNGK